MNQVNEKPNNINLRASAKCEKGRPSILAHNRNVNRKSELLLAKELRRPVSTPGSCSTFDLREVEFLRPKSSEGSSSVLERSFSYWWWCGRINSSVTWCPSVSETWNINFLSLHFSLGLECTGGKEELRRRIAWHKNSVQLVFQIVIEHENGAFTLFHWV